MNKTPAAEDIRAHEKIPTGTINQPELTVPAPLIHEDQPVQPSKATEAAQRAAPLRRPLFGT